MDSLDDKKFLLELLLQLNNIQYPNQRRLQVDDIIQKYLNTYTFTTINLLPILREYQRGLENTTQEWTSIDQQASRKEIIRHITWKITKIPNHVTKMVMLNLFANVLS